MVFKAVFRIIFIFFCKRFAIIKNLRRFAFPIQTNGCCFEGRLPDSIKVVQRFLVPFV